MTNRRRSRLFILLLLLTGSGLQAQTWTPLDDPLAGHLRVGLQYHRTYLHDHTRLLNDSFRGSITHLEVQQDESPFTALTLEWRFNSYIGTQFSWEQVRARTRTTQENSTLNHTDGDIFLFGPGLTLLLRYPNPTRLTPFLGLGATWLNAEFEHNPAWQNGFSGPDREAKYDAWVASGRPPWPNKGYRRTITLEDCPAWILTYGLDVRITDQLDASLFVQIMEVDGVDLTQRITFVNKLSDTQMGSFPMSNTSYGAGLRWTF